MKAAPPPVCPRGRTSAHAALLAACIATAGASAHAGPSRCERRACENIRFLNAQIAMSYEACCRAPADERTARLSEIQDKAHATLSLALIAKQACDEKDGALAREAARRIRDLWLPTVVRSADGKVVNQMIALGSRDYIVIDATLPRLPDSCTPIADAVATDNACTYTVPANTTFNMRFGDIARNSLSLSGSIAVAQTAAAFPSTGVGPVGLPTDDPLTARFLGQTITLDLDRTCPYNVLRVDANGNGALCVALTVDSNSPALVGFIQIGSTIYFELPVQVAKDWSAIRIHADASVPGHLLTPTDPVALAGADNPSSAVNAEDPWADTNENGLPDGADEVIYAINSRLNCRSTAQH